MQTNYVDIPSISSLHSHFGYASPRHPMVSFVDFKKEQGNQKISHDTLYRLSFYSVLFKSIKGTLRYGRSHYDFEEGTLMFTAPQQVISGNHDLYFEEGWGLFFHPDLLKNAALGKSIDHYSFFYYEANEALHVSEEEKHLIRVCAENIQKEYQQRIDQHSQRLIQSNIGLLLDYCSRFYDRQFLTRSGPAHDIVQRFEKHLKTYFSQETLIEHGLPGVGYFASALSLSPNYLSDLLKRYTGKTALEHIHLQLTEKAKNLLCSTGLSVSEVAYRLGFEYPSHFTKIFKLQTGVTPKAFRLIE